MSKNVKKDNLNVEDFFKVAKSNVKKLKIPNFPAEKKNVIHGSNVNAYIEQLSAPFLAELTERAKSTKNKVLRYSLDDAGNIDCFLDIFGEYVKYNTDKQCNYYWSGRLWKPDNDKRIQLWIQTALRSRRDYTFKQLKKNPATEKRDEIMNYAKKCFSMHNHRAIYEGAKSLVACKDSLFDTNPHLLNVLNGTINLKKGTLKKQDYQDYITMMIPFQYHKDASTKKLERFLSDTFNESDLIEYVQRLLGYCISGETKEQVVHFFIGNGANGKSTLLSLVRHIMNGYAKVIPSKVLTSIERAGSASSEIAQLPHKRLVCCSEFNCTDVLNEGKIKIMSSGETLTARQLYSEAFTFDPEFKCIIDTNYLPQILGTDHGIWRRIRVVPFENIVSDEKMNKNLLKELKKSGAGALKWLVEGAVKYYSEGLGSCKVVDSASKKYRKSQDTLGAFIDNCVKHSEGSMVRARELYQAYLGFCNDNLLNPMSEAKFGKDFAVRGFKRGKDKISRKYLDIKLKAEK